MSFAKESRGRRGFTLVELMVSVVLGALLIGIVLNFVTTQSRIATAQSGREEVQQNARGALELVASDLRGAVSSGIVTGDADAIELLLPRRWGVVCGQTGTTRTVVAFPNLPSQPTPVGVDAGLLFQTAAGWRPTLPARATVNTSTVVPVAASCPNATGNVVALQLDGANHPANVPVGTTVALYQMVRYEVQTSRGSRWIYRSNGMTTGGVYVMQPLAGPLAEAGGLSFAYFTGTPPVEMLGAPGAAAAAQNPPISQVRLRVRMQSRQGSASSRQVEFDSATVQIRNDN
ncbi:MAG TPA: prepilin-type N-terminal cleavage/methylation domain-containing protein [Longimicrobium sp.]|nr:prepilin-type N-terminal cleavage/methylation domain-containing protein [Longimicrobium sp.]